MLPNALKRLLAAALAVAIVLICASCGVRGDSRPLACLSLSDRGDNFTETVAETFTKKFTDYGYRVYVTFCDSIQEQSRQITNFITKQASIIIVDCVGESAVYEELFYEAASAGCRVAVLGGDGSIQNCPVQIISYSVLEGARMCELVKRYLDEYYPDAAPGSVNVLLLATVAKSEQAKAYAGYCLLAEKYIRHFDIESLRFVKEDRDEIVYYRDAYGAVFPVDEPVGGLILDEDGYAVLNPYYDQRVTLRVHSLMNLQTAISGQSAIDALVTKNEKINVVIAMNGSVAIGAAERLQYYKNMGIVSLPAEKLAVFGEGDTAYNRELVLKSLENESLLRGFVGWYKIEWAADNIVSALRFGGDRVVLEMDSLSSVPAPNKKEVGIMTKLIKYGNLLDDPNVIFTQDPQPEGDG